MSGSQAQILAVVMGLRDLEEQLHQMPFKKILLNLSIKNAGQPWLLRLGPFYEFFERYLPASTREGQLVRQWCGRWDQRVAGCEAGKATWPQFLTKREGSDFR